MAPSSLAGLILFLGVGASSVEARSPEFELDPTHFDTTSAPCLGAHNQGQDIVAEYLGGDHEVQFRAGSWLGRDGRYLLPEPAPEIERIRFRALEGIDIDPSDVALAPCPSDLPEIAIQSLTRAIDLRLAHYLGNAAESADLATDYEAVIAALEPIPHHHWLAVAHFEFASFLRAADRLDEARDHYGAARSLFETIDDPGGQAASTSSLGLVALRQGQLAEAAARFDEAQPSFLQLGDIHSVAAVDNNLGLLYMRRGQLDEAATHLEMALTVLQGPADLRSDAPNPSRGLPPDSPAELSWALNTLNNLAIVRRQHGSVDLAERYWRNVLALEGHASRAQTGAEARYNLGGLLLREGRLDEALVLLSEAVARFDATDARRWMVETRVMLSQLYFRLGDSETALDFAQEAIALEPEDRNARLRAYRHLANLQQEAGNHDAATAAIDQAMTLIDDRPGNPQFLMLNSRRAHLQLLAGDSADAIEIQQAVHSSVSEMDWPAEAARVEFRLALALMAAGRSAEARPLVENALTIFRDTGEVFHELQALEALGRLKSTDAHTRLDASTRAFERALQLRQQPLSDTRRIGLSATLAQIDHRHVRLLTDQSMPEQAWAAVARIRNTDARELDQARQRGRTRSERRALLAEHAALVDELHHRRLGSDGSAKTADLALQIDRVETRLRQLHEQPRPGVAPSLADVRQRLGDNRLLLSYYLLPDQGLLWAVSEGQVRMHELPGSSSIEASIAELLTRLRHPRQAPGAIDRLVRELGSTLLAPASDMIGQARQVVIEPHGMLHMLPFGLLIDDARPLVDRVAVERVVSAGRTTTRAAEGIPGSARLLVVANPGWQDHRGQQPGPMPRRSLIGQLMRDNALSRLPGTQHEAELLAELARPGLEVRLTTGRAASRQFVIGGGLAGYPLVHLATHGLVDLRYPSLSALLLADQHGSGATLLRPQEIAELRLDADLVVLSGCETGTGAIPAGEGALSLARPFLVAGAGQVVSTLWKIDDQRTAQFMRSFYEHLLEAKSTPAGALAAAQREMRQQPATAHPYYWAGFVVTSAGLQP